MTDAMMAEAEEKHQRAHKLALEKKFEEARDLWGQAAKVEHLAAMVCYGTCLLNGMGMRGGAHNGSKVGFGRPNGPRAQEVFQRAAKVGSLRASRTKQPLCKDAQAAFYNFGVCLRDNVGAPLREDGTHRYELSAREADAEWEKFKASRAEWMARTYRTPADFAAAKAKFFYRLRRREREEAAARKKLSEECFQRCKNEWKASAKWVHENLSSPVPGGPKFTNFGAP